VSRLFVTPRDLNFISDITKEVIKDVIGQFCYYYPISELKTQTHEVYNEALRKFYDNPIKIDCLVDPQQSTDTKVDQFSIDAQWKITVYAQWRDFVNKGINPCIGDYISFSDVFYEITERVFDGYIYGLPEHKRGVKLMGIKARESLFKAITLGPTDISRPEPDAVQTTFVQQRGFVENSEGPTGDVRDMQQNGLLDPPQDGPREVSSKGDPDGVGSAFYDDEVP